ncbi:MAG: hypothetical protein ACE149_13915 [Armatimonadota bacterium]
MDNELDLLLGAAINSLLKLDILLYLSAQGIGVVGAEDLAAQLRRPAQQVAAAADELAQAGLVDRFPLGTGRHVLYAPAEDEHVKEIVALLQERYRHPESRAWIVRAAIGSGPEP